MSKSADDFFSDWESHAFGFGYGSGEPHTIRALKEFLALCPAKGGYDYATLEAELGGRVTWLLINALCRHGVDILEYGTSPRFAWLTPKGRALKAFVDGKPADELVALGCRDHEYIPCYPDACNCGEDGYEEGRVCPNPFFHDRFTAGKIK